MIMFGWLGKGQEAESYSEETAVGRYSRRLTFVEAICTQFHESPVYDKYFVLQLEIKRVCWTDF